ARTGFDASSEYVAADPHVLLDHRAWDHHRQRGQRRRRHHDLLDRRCAVRLLDAVAAASDYAGADRDTGDVRAYGYRHWKRARRSDPRALRRADHRDRAPALRTRRPGKYRR